MKNDTSRSALNRHFSCWAATVVVTATLCSVTHSATSPTTEQHWQALYDQAQAAYATGDFSVAEQAAALALEKARTGQGQTQPFIASSLNVLALIYQQQGRIAEAVDLLQQALSISETALGVHANTASIALNLANAQEAAQQIQAALKSYENALALADQSGARTIVNLALAALSRLHAATGELEKSANSDQRLLSGIDALPPALRAEVLLRQGQRLVEAGDILQAQEALQQALQSAEQAHGSENVLLLPALSALATLYSASDQLDDAAPLHRRAVAILQNPTVADASGALAGHLNELALWHSQRKEYAEAHLLLEQALELTREHHGEQSLEAAHILSSQAQLEGEIGNQKSSKELHKQALAVFQALGTDNMQGLLGQARSLNFLAGFDYRTRRFDLAEEKFLQSLQLFEQAVGTDNELLSPILENLEALYLSQGKSIQARQYRQRLNAIPKAEISKNSHP